MITGIKPIHILTSGWIIVLSLGLWVRLWQVEIWENNPEHHFYEEKPILSSNDGYYYLNYARALEEGTYDDYDEQRTKTPPQPASLLSYLLFWVHNIFGWDYLWIGAYLPVITGILVAIPIYGLGHIIGGRMAGFFSATFALITPFNVQRTGFARLDTDGLILLFTFCAIWFAWQLIHSKGKKWLIWLALLLLNALLLWWWWDQARLESLILTFYPLLAALSLRFLDWKSWKSWLSLVCVFSVFVAVLIIATGGFDSFHLYIRSRLLHLFGMSPVSALSYASITNELHSSTFQEVVYFTTENLPVFIIAVLGLILLFLNKWKLCLLFLPIYFIGILGVFMSTRFLLFLCPLIAIGLAQVIFFPFTNKRLLKYLKALRLTGALGVILIILYENHNEVPNKPFYKNYQVHALHLLKQVTPPDAYIWANWPMGNGILYYADRGVFCDGAQNSGNILRIMARPLLATSERQAANYMRFFATRGYSNWHLLCRAFSIHRKNLEAFTDEILAAGPQEAKSILASHDFLPTPNFMTIHDWLEYFFPASSTPVYLYLDLQLFEQSKDWLRFGFFDRKTRTIPDFNFESMIGTQWQSPLLKYKDQAIINTENGSTHLGTKTFTIHQSRLRFKSETKIQNYPTGVPIALASVPEKQYGALMDEHLLDTVYVSLYLGINLKSSFFKPLEINPPFYQIWEVSGDEYTLQKTTE